VVKASGGENSKKWWQQGRQFDL